MSEYDDLDLATLIELLVALTNVYDEMLSTRVFSEEEFARCTHTLAELHARIKEKAKLEGYNTDNIFPNIPDMKTIREGAKPSRRTIRGRQ